MEDKLYKLEALRGFAALYVMVHHSLPHTLIVAGINFAYLIRFGQEAVILFFLVSGFVIHHAFHFARDKSFGNYFLKRFLRIYIPLIVVFVLSFVVRSIEQGALANIETWELAGNLLMLQDWDEAKPFVMVSGYFGNDPLWSLSYEWWFYMAFYPLMTYIKERTKRDNLVFGIAFAASLIYFIFPHYFIRLPMYLAIWWVGVCLSHLYLSNELSLKAVRKPLFALSCISIVLALNVANQAGSGKDVTFGYHPVLELRHFGFAICVILIALYWRAKNWVFFDKLLKPFMIFAPISYMIYIAHFPLFSEASYLSFVGNVVIEWVLYFTIVVLTAYLVELRLYPTIKKPLMAIFYKSPLSDSGADGLQNSANPS